MEIEKMLSGEGGYVFVSHSHLDIRPVREVRNYLEDRGLEPILFYLRCMDGGQEGQTDALKKLIYDEIDARQFFLYLDSENARSSEWVRSELEYAKRNYPERVISMALSDSPEQWRDRLDELVRRVRVFISSSAADLRLARRIGAKLIEKDFRVYDLYEHISGGDVWCEQVELAIDSVAKEGCVLLLLTERSIHSAPVRHELRAALLAEARILPVLVGGVEIPPSLSLFLAKYPHQRISDAPTDEELDALVALMKRAFRPDGAEG